jgi:DNA polymerase elongation subunit (family B)
LNILTLDIETSPNLADVWGLWNNNVSLSQLRESSHVLCWAAKWKGEKELLFCSEWCDEGDDMIRWAHSLLDEADAVVTYNGDHFDFPTLNKEFLLKGLTPPSPYQSIDLYKTIKRKFKFPSSKLEYVCSQLGIGKKTKHEGHELWVKVMACDPVSQKKMEKYCKNDVFPLTEKLHDKILPWITNYPNRVIYGSMGECTRCDLGVLMKRGFHYTTSGKYQTYRCNSCGGWTRDTKRLEGVGVRTQ